MIRFWVSDSRNLYRQNFRFKQFYFLQCETKRFKKKKKKKEEFGTPTHRERMPIILLLVDGSPRRLRQWVCYELDAS